MDRAAAEHNSTREAAGPPVNIGRQFLILALGWSLFTLMAMGLDMWHTWQNSLVAGRLQARAALEQDILFHNWNASIGGVYGPAGKDPPPGGNYAADPDAVTGAGKKLTLISPASMTRRIHDLAESRHVVSGRITSLTPIDPDNAPDQWEREALQRFAMGEQEAASREDFGEEEFMRVMRPLRATEDCLGCHRGRGYAVGDVLGGIGARISMREMRALSTKHILTVYLLYAGIWLVGLLALGTGAWRLRGQINERAAMQIALQDFKLSLDNINDSVLMFDTNTLEFFYGNRGAWNLTGYSDQELLGKTLPDLFHPEELISFYAILGPLFRNVADSLTFESNFVHRDGHPIPVEIHIAYVVPRAGADRFLAVVRDISERKNAEREKEAMQIRLLQAQKLESVGQLAAGIAHEINTPIQYIMTNIDFLQESYQTLSPLLDRPLELVADERTDGEIAESIREYAESLARVDWEFLREEMPLAVEQSLDGLRRVSSLVLALKDFSHPGGKLKIPEDLNAIIETTVAISKNEWKYVADLETDLARDLPLVPCLRNEIGQILLNLIVNAAQAIAARHSPEREEPEKGLIAVTTRQNGGWAEIEVRDTGIGIPAEIQGRIFDPFFTTKEVGKGSGQGLAICRDVIVQKHQGQLTFSSEYGVGSIFTVRLPLSAAGA